LKNNPVLEKSFIFAVEIVKLTQKLQREKKEYVLSKQILRSGTSIGALVREAQYAESHKDFIHKMTIALKEANETEYWVFLLYEGEYIMREEYDNIHPQINEILKLLISITKSSKQNCIKK
jgi:four helix bundle protein